MFSHWSARAYSSHTSTFKACITLTNIPLAIVSHMTTPHANEAKKYFCLQGSSKGVIKIILKLLHASEYLSFVKPVHKALSLEFLL